MLDLFISELKRYRHYASIAAAVLLAFLFYFDGQQPLMANPVEQVVGYTLSVVLLGLAFSITQMVLHRRKSHWAYLVHRPLPIQHIFAAIAGAGALLIVLVATLPVLVMLIINDLRSVDLVETRHYLFVLHIGLIALFCYFVGVYTALNPSWASLLSIGLIYFVMVSDPITPWFNLLSDLVCVVLLFFLAKSSFKENLGLHFVRKREIFLATAVTHTLIIGLLYVSQMLFYHLPLFILGEHPDQYDKQQLNGYYAQLWQLDNQELVDLVVDESIYPNKETLKAQMALAPSYHIRSKFEALPVQGQLFHQDKSYALEDKANQTRWLFSHHDMLFIGKHQLTGDVVGYIGPNSFYAGDINLADIAISERFTNVPVVDKGYIIRTENTLYIVDFDARYIEVKHALADGEFYLRDMQTSGDIPALAYVSNKALYIFDKANFNQANVYTDAHTVIKHHRAMRGLSYITVYELVNGYVVEYKSSQYFGFEKPGIGLLLSNFDGSTTLLGETQFKRYRPLPDAIVHQEVIMSPLSFALGFKYLESLSKSPKDPDYVSLAERIEFDYPQSVYAGVIVMWLLCAISTFVLGRWQRLSITHQVFWQVIILLFSLGGFVSFLLMHRWRELLKRPKQAPSNKNSLRTRALSSFS